MSKRITVYRNLRILLTESAFNPYKPLPIRRFERAFKSSSIPIREALLELSREGLVRHVPGYGFFGRHFELSELSGCLDMLGYFLTDAARYLFGNTAPYQTFTEHINSRPMPALEPQNRDLLADYRRFLIRILCRCYRSPHALYLGNAIDLVNAVIKSELASREARLECHRFIRKILLLLEKRELDSLLAEIDFYVAERKAYLPETLAHITKCYDDERSLDSSIELMTLRASLDSERASLL